MDTDTKKPGRYSFSNDLDRLERSRGPKDLRRWTSLVRASLGGLRVGQADVEDAVQDLVGGLLQLPARHPETWHRLRKVSEETLRRWLRLRARWGWLDQLPGGPARRALRGLVRQALRIGLPPSPLAPPASLRVAGHFSLALVSRAAAWVVSSSPDPLREAGAIAGELARRWAWELDPSAQPPEEAPPPASLDARRLARRLFDGLGDLDRRLLAARAEGRSYAEIELAHRVPRATACRRVRELVMMLAGCGKAGEFPADEALQVLFWLCRAAQR